MKSMFEYSRGAWLLALSFCSTVAFAHHSKIGRFDTTTLDEIEGEISAVRFANPHVTFELIVQADDGQQTVWEVETATANTLRRLGVTADLLKVGDRVRVAGFPPTGARKEMYGHNLLLPDGRELLVDLNAELRWSGESVGSWDYWSEEEGDKSRPDLGIFRVWSFTTQAPWLFPEIRAAGGVDFNINSYPLTDAARTALANFNRATGNPSFDCTPKGMPTIMDQPYPIEFSRRGADIVLHIEEYDIARVIHMGGQDSLGDPAASPLGYSVGNWESDTLVVTTNRLDWPYFSQAGIPQSADSVIVERFTPTPDGDRLDYSMTVLDPGVFSEPVTQSTYWLYQPDLEVLPFECAFGD